MAQDIIDIGPQPNDGQGDNLRTAFDKTNDNFTQIWTAGPVGSNVRVAGNVISTLQVNQDLALSPNGVGNVRLNNNTIPGANNTWFLGSATMQWRGLYAASVETGNITITGTLDVPGDAVIQGNLTVEGNTIQIGNIVTDTKTIQLANTAANTIQANGSGITVGASDNIATFLYNSTSNSWVTNLQITNANGQPIGTTPGGSNTYIQFNNAGNFGGNANFTYNRATGNFYLGGANLRAVSGNNQPYILQVPGIAFQGGQAIMEWDAVNQHVDVSNSFSISGTLQLYGNYPGTGALITTSGGSGVDIEIEPSGNLYLNADGGEVIVSDQTASVDPNTGALKVLGGIGVNGNINVGGNISAVGWTGNLIPSANAVYSLGNSTKYWANLWVANNTIYIGGVPLGMTAGNVLTVGGNAVLQNNSNSTISTTGNITANYFVGNGSLLTGLAATYGNANVVANLAALGSNPISTTGNISGNYFVGNGSQLTGIVSSYGNANVANYLPTFSGNISAGNVSASGNITGNYIFGNGSQLTGITANTGNVTFSNQIVLGTGANDGTGGLYLAPGNDSIANSAVQYLRVRGGDVATHIHLDTGNNAFYDQYFGNDSKFVKLEAGAAGNVVVGTDDNGNSYNWNFGTDGRLTFPGTPRIDTDSDNFEVQAAESISLEANAVVNIYTDSSGNAYQWQFGDDGNLTLPTDGYLVVTTGIIGSGASPAPSLSGFSSIATTGSPGNISASGNLLVSGYANITGNINGSNAIFSGNISGNTAGFAIGYLNIPQVAFTANATLAATDAGKHYYSTLATANTLTIANNTSVSWVVGTAITVVNRGSGNITVAQGSGVSLYLAGNSSAANRTVSTYGMATLLNVAANVWMINGTGVS